MCRSTYVSPFNFFTLLTCLRFILQVGAGSLIPLELCEVERGQIMRKQIPPEKTKDVIDFASKKPPQRLQSIRDGLGVLAWGQSEYVRQFGLSVTNPEPLSLSARVLMPPTLKYGEGSKQPTIAPRDGAWNMIDKRFYKPTVIRHWAVVVYERQQRFNEITVQELVKGFIDSCNSVGMKVLNPKPIIKWENAQGSIHDVSRFFPVRLSSVDVETNLMHPL